MSALQNDKQRLEAENRRLKEQLNDADNTREVYEGELQRLNEVIGKGVGLSNQEGAKSSGTPDANNNEEHETQMTLLRLELTRLNTVLDAKSCELELLKSRNKANSSSVL